MRIIKRVTAGVVFAAACFITGCGFLEDSSSSEKNVFEATSSDSAACKVSSDDFLLISADLTRIPEVKEGKTAYLIAYNTGMESLSSENTGGAYLKNIPSLSAEVENEFQSCAGSDAYSGVQESNADFYIQQNCEIARKLQNLSLEQTVGMRSAEAGQGVSRTCTVGEKSAFYISYDEKTYQEVEFTLEASGENCNIWYYDDINYSYLDVSESSFDETFYILAEKFDSVFYAEQAVFGSYKIENKNGAFISTPEKIDILIFDIENDAVSSANGGGTYGFFRTIDIYTEQPVSILNQKESAGYRTNLAECFYIDAYFLKNSPEKIYETLVHEFQHLLGFINTTVNNGTAVYETWYTEMMSQLAEDILISYLGIEYEDSFLPGRMSCFNLYHNLGFYDWKSSVYAVYAGYGDAYLFGSYLAHSYGGIDFIRTIAQCGKINEAAVTFALKQTVNSDDFYTAFYKWGKSVLDGSLENEINEKVCEYDFTLHGINVWDYSYTVSRSSIESNYYIYTENYDTSKVIAGGRLFYGPLIFKNTDTNYFRASLGRGGFYITNIGTVKEGDYICANKENTSNSIRMFVYFK
ncbi:MAG: hypothetical protein MSA36_07645 [Treponema porcinum]|uniref:hypothetical protein n=2 Tax=Treponema porcinum TaxID=261392 RepID=UPI002352DE7D|nr:hypothetical protein [Treponema porcinum]MCI7534851.1 hypothetical protein [Treponema porcinum]